MENTMLIVDDSEMNREILKLLFHGKYMVLEAETGQEAMGILKGCNGNIDVVLLDLVMPELDGMEVLRQRQKLDYFRKVPVIVITSSDSVEDQIEAFNPGASDFINKPFVPEIVMSRVDNIMTAQQRLLMMQLEAEKMKVKAELDQMTTLYNKSTSEYLISEMLRTNKQNRHAMLVIDIDNFKSVNDISGHMAGDHTIKIVADTISSLFRKTDIVGRIGGDEFVVLMTNIPSMEIVYRKVDELVMLMKYKPNLTIPANVSLSIGFAQSRPEMLEYSQLFKEADAALYQAKCAGKARAQEFGREIRAIVEDERSSALMIGRDRAVCGAVQTMCPKELRIIEALTLGDLEKLPKEDRDKTVIVFIDVSDLEDSGELWEKLEQSEWMAEIPWIAICEEGNLQQYRRTLNVERVADIFTYPLEEGAFRRRTLRQLEGIIGENKDKK